MTLITVAIWPGNDELVIEFITTYSVRNDAIWYSFVRSVDGERVVDYDFWLDDDLWRKLLKFVRRQELELIEQIANRPDRTDPQARDILQRLRQEEVTVIHQAAAVLTVELVRQSPKPTPEVLGKDEE